MGFSMRRLLRDLRDDNLASVAPRSKRCRKSPFPPSGSGIAACWGIDPDAALCAYLWSWAENQVMAALKPCRSARPPASACWRIWAARFGCCGRRESCPKRLVQLHAGLRDRLRPPRNPVFTSFQILNHEQTSPESASAAPSVPARPP
jgi:hypothetical protein